MKEKNNLNNLRNEILELQNKIKSNLEISDYSIDLIVSLLEALDNTASLLLNIEELLRNNIKDEVIKVDTSEVINNIISDFNSQIANIKIKLNNLESFNFEEE